MLSRFVGPWPSGGRNSEEILAFGWVLIKVAIFKSKIFRLHTFRNYFGHHPAMYKVKRINLFDSGYTRQAKEYVHDTCSKSLPQTKAITRTEGCTRKQRFPDIHGGADGQVTQ